MSGIGFIGSGRIAESIARQIVQKKQPQSRFCYERQRIVKNFIASDPSSERRKVFDSMGFATTESNQQVLPNSDVVFLVTKPDEAVHAISEMKSKTTNKKPLFVSLVGNISAGVLERMLGPGARVIRLLPESDMTTDQKVMNWGTFRGKNASEQDVKNVIQLFGPCAHETLEEPPSLLDEIASVLHSGVSDSNFSVKHNCDLFQDHYEIRQLLGKGAFSSVYEAIDLDTGKVYAVKCVDNEDNITSEIAALNHLKHENIITLHALYSESSGHYLVTEYCHSNVQELVEIQNQISEAVAKDILKQLLKAVQYCHAKGFVHRDIKAENVLFNEETPGKFNIKLADFGVSEELSLDSSRLNTLCGTPGYLSPETLNGAKYSPAADIWSVGILTYIMLHGYPPFFHVEDAQLYKQIRQGIVLFGSDISISSEGKDFLMQMLDIHPDTRSTASELLQHPWLKA